MRRQGHANMSGYASDKLRVVQTLGGAQRSLHMRQPHACMRPGRANRASVLVTSHLEHPLTPSMATRRDDVADLFLIAAKPILQLLNTGLNPIPGASVVPQGLQFVLEALEVSSMNPCWRDCKCKCCSG